MSDLKDETLRRAQELADFKLLSSGDIPKIDLYMEQVTSLLEQEMGPSLRRKDESVFTNTMINNYSKEGVLPRPEIKRFTSHIENTEQLDNMYGIFYDLVGGYEKAYRKDIEEKLSRIEHQCKDQGVTDESSIALTLIALLSFEAALNTMLSSQLLDYCKEKKEERLQQEEEASKAHKQEESNPEEQGE